MPRPTSANDIVVARAPTGSTRKRNAIEIAVALVAGLSETLDGEVAGAVLFLGLGLTFAALSLVRTPAGGLRWALIPAGVMLLLGLAVLVATGNELFRYLWPVALILVGLYLLARTFLTRHPELAANLHMPAAPGIR